MKNMNLDQFVNVVRDVDVTNNIGSGIEMFTPTQNVYDYNLSYDIFNEVVLIDSLDQYGNVKIDSKLELSKYLDEYNVIETKLD